MLSSSEASFPIKFFVEPLSKSLQNELGRNIRVYTVDARNHGLSAHSDTFCLESMSVDLDEFIARHRLNGDAPAPLILLGHSMGAKVNMLYSLLRGDNVAGIVSLDASPANYTHRHRRIFDAMEAVDFSKVHKKSDADQQLQHFGIVDGSERGYILENVTNRGGWGWGWKCNLDGISQNEHEVHSFPDSGHMVRYERSALFLGGYRGSDRLTDPKYLDDLALWFPRHRIQLFDGGHFIHRTHQREVEREVVRYISGCI